MVLRSVVRWLHRNGVAPYGALGDPLKVAVYMAGEAVTSAVVAAVFFALSALHVRDGRAWYLASMALSAMFTLTFGYAAIYWSRRRARYLALERRHRDVRSFFTKDAVELRSFATDAVEPDGASVQHAIPLRSALLVVLAIVCTSQLGAAAHYYHAKLPLLIASMLVAGSAIALSIGWCVRQWTFARVAQRAPVVLVTFDAAPDSRGRFSLRLDGLAATERDVRHVALCDDRGTVIAACDVREQRVDALGVCTVLLDVLSVPRSTLQTIEVPTRVSLMVAPGVTVHARCPAGFAIRT